MRLVIIFFGGGLFIITVFNAGCRVVAQPTVSQTIHPTWRGVLANISRSYIAVVVDVCTSGTGTTPVGHLVVCSVIVILTRVLSVVVIGQPLRW